MRSQPDCHPRPISIRALVCSFCVALAIAVAPHPSFAQAAWTLDESPARPQEWGFRPSDGETVAANPPGFVWRPQKKAAHYTLQIAGDPTFDRITYEAGRLELNCHCPYKTLPEGMWYWRFRCTDSSGESSKWSGVRSFTVTDDSREMPMPPREELLARIPKDHPRLFLRPEDLPELRRRIATDLANPYAILVRKCDALLKSPPPIEEPPKYPEGMVRGSDEWKSIWWGNRMYTISVLDGAAMLAFTSLLDDNEDYAKLAKRLLLDAAKWNPQGSTNLRYNDEAGMPYAYYFARAYTFLHDRLTEQEREICREVLRERGRQIDSHLRPNHIWQPYNSHNNRMWHFLGEVGIATTGDVPEADDWIWFAMNEIYNAYPVWSDDDGGWHEGVSYWSSYISRFTWWADVMQSAMGINAFDKPYFSQAGYYAMYLQPPGTRGGGFGDLCASRTSGNNVQLMNILAGQSGNPHWQWYVDQHPGDRPINNYVDFLRVAMSSPEAKPPTDLPTSRLFAGTGLTLLSARDNVEIIFKSSPFGTHSHGYESNNSFLLYAFGERLLIRTGLRDMYGSDHHKNWMWHSKSTNCITVNGESQTGHSSAAQGRIVDFVTSEHFDLVVGEAAEAYDGKLERFTRSILFVKPELIVIFDQLAAPKPSSFEWRLHAPTAFQPLDESSYRVVNNKAACDVLFLYPNNLEISQTDKFDPPPRPRIKLVEHHLTAVPAEKHDQAVFITLIRPHRTEELVPQRQTLEQVENGYIMEADLTDGRVAVLLRTTESGAISYGDLKPASPIAGVRFGDSGAIVSHFRVGEP